MFDNTFFGYVFLVLKHMLENKGCVLEFFFLVGGGGVGNCFFLIWVGMLLFEMLFDCFWNYP